MINQVQLPELGKSIQKKAFSGQTQNNGRVGEATLTSSQDQTRITTKLEKIILNNQLNIGWREAL